MSDWLNGVIISMDKRVPDLCLSDMDLVFLFCLGSCVVGLRLVKRYIFSYYNGDFYDFEESVDFMGYVGFGVLGLGVVLW